MRALTRGGVALALLAVGLVGPVSAPGGALAPPADGPEGATALVATPVGTFASPVGIEAAPGMPDTMFVVERPGTVRLIHQGQRVEQPFLDIRSIVRGLPDDPDAGGEEGLLSVGFPPDYATTGLFYVLFTNVRGDVEIDEFRRSATDPLRADRTTRRLVLVIPHPGAQNHNGGRLVFTPAGLLLASVGDGGASAPRGHNAVDLGSLLGKILRISPRPTATRRYRIPPTNPYVGVPGRDEIYAYGLRNPWRIALDEGRFSIGDVGQVRYEEVDFLRLADAAGANFGWPAYEGFEPYDPTQPGADPPVFPVLAYEHGEAACAITGGFVVDAAGPAELAGRYVYADYCNGEVRSFRPVRQPDGSYTAAGDRSDGLTVERVSTFGQGADGTLYAAQVTGPVVRIE